MAFPSQTLISRSASVLELEYDKTSVVDLAVGYKWDNIQTAKEDAKAWVMDKGESYKVKKSDQKRLILECLAADTCQFHLRIYTSQASRHWKLLSYNLHALYLPSEYLPRLLSTTRKLVYCSISRSNNPSKSSNQSKGYCR